MAAATLDGVVAQLGNCSEPFSIQSLSKLFALCALLHLDPDAWTDVGWGPTDAGYGSVADLERTHGRPRNPFVNSGALIVTDRLLTRTGNAVAATIDLMRTIDPDNAITSDPEVARSEMLTGHRNSAIAHVLAEHHRLTNGIDKLITLTVNEFRRLFIALLLRPASARLSHVGLDEESIDLSS